MVGEVAALELKLRRVSLLRTKRTSRLNTALFAKRLRADHERSSAGQDRLGPSRSLVRVQVLDLSGQAAISLQISLIGYCMRVRLSGDGYSDGRYTGLPEHDLCVTATTGTCVGATEAGVLAVAPGCMLGCCPETRRPRFLSPSPTVASRSRASVI